MQKIIVLFAGSLFALSVVFAVAAAPTEITLSNNKGDVTFPHVRHQGMFPDCTTCHHNGIEAPKCTGCHDGKAGVADAKKIFHARCKGCHRKAGGPTKCKECHDIT